MNSQMRLYNSLTGRVEDFRPNEPGKVKLYTCGPTVYHNAHIGNLRSYIMEDILEKTLCYLDYEVMRAMNITDVGHLASDADTGEDKMLKGAKREKKTVMEIARFYTDAFFNDCRKLNVKIPDICVPATDCIRDFIDMISVLIDKGYAYYAGGNVYFDTSKLDRYYVLTGQEEEARAVGVRDSVEEDANKRNKSDFVLWFTKSKFENQELKWDSPWGLGYPGWHIECSSIAIKHLGPHLDIHCGGIDNAFPHHNNEIAQSEAFLGHKWCNIWFHVLHLNHNEGKMSKSEGGFLTVSMLEEQNYDPMVYRLYCLLSHYRKPLSFGFDVLDNTASVYRKLIDRIRGLKDGGAVEHQKAEAFRQSFIEALCGDINTASAVKVLYDVFKADISDKTKLYLVCDFDKVLSLNLIKAAHSVLNIDDRLQTYIESKIRERLQARMNKDYDLADSIRDELTKQGITIKDTREGTSWDLINKTG